MSLHGDRNTSRVRFRRIDALSRGFTPPQSRESDDRKVLNQGTDTFTLPSVSRKGAAQIPRSIREEKKKRKAVCVARTDAAGNTVWEEQEVRYGRPRVKPFALNCTFGLPRVLNHEPPGRVSAFPPRSKTTTPAGSPRSRGPSSRLADHPRRDQTPSLSSTPAPHCRSQLECVRDLDAARDVNPCSFEAFVKPRDQWPASEDARQNVQPIASVTRARRRHNTGDSSSDSDNEVDMADAAERLPKLLQRHKRLTNEIRKQGGHTGHMQAVGGLSTTHSPASVNFRQSFLGSLSVLSPSPVSFGSSTRSRQRTSPRQRTLEVAASVLEYELAWAKEQVRRVHEQERIKEGV